MLIFIIVNVHIPCIVYNIVKLLLIIKYLAAYLLQVQSAPRYLYFTFHFLFDWIRRLKPV
jgi:hypothetical protein